MRRLFTILIFIVRSTIGAEHAPVKATPVLKRTPPPAKKAVVASVPELPPAKPDAIIEVTATPPSLDPETQLVVAMAAKWQSDTAGPVLSGDGRILYPYGRGLPVIVCAPLRVCLIELQAGERLSGDPHIGDNRWGLLPAAFGTGDDATQAIILKPDQPGLDTSLYIPTTRRAYYMRLLSRHSEYIGRVAFSYPEDESKKWMAANLPPPPPKNVIAPADALNFRYKIKGGNKHIRPVRVYDDARAGKTYIQMPESAQTREMPILYVIGEDGKGVMSNYRVVPETGTYVVDRLADRMQLRIGTKRRGRVSITRENRG